MDKFKNISVAVIIPCLNEDLTIQATILEFRKFLPTAIIYVIDNGSSDNTCGIVTQLTTEIDDIRLLNEPLKGKGLAIRNAFNSIDADLYLMVDGDSTYPADYAQELLEAVNSTGFGMAVGDRITSGSYEKQNERKFHSFGNSAISKLANILFNSNQRDILSGYRAFTRKFVKTFPITVSGFELETHMTLHALDKKIPIIQIPVEYRARPNGSYSKLNTFRDGFKIVNSAFSMLLNYKPRKFMNVLASITFGLSLASGAVPISDYITSRYVVHVPLAILSVGLAIFSLTLFITGLILHAISEVDRRNFEISTLAYKAIIRGKK